MNIRAQAIALACALPLLAQEAPPEEARQGVEAAPVELSLRFRPGTRLVYEARQTVEATTGELGTTTVQTAFEVERELEPVEGGGARVVETWRSVLQEVGAGGKTHTLDTRDGTSSGLPEVDCLRGLVGGSIRWEVDPAGKVSRLEGGPALAERVIARVPEEQRELWRLQLASTLSDEVLTRQAEEGFLSFPAGPLQPGDGWRRTSPLAVPPIGDLERTQDFVYLGLVDRNGTRCAKLWVRTRVAGVADRRVEVEGHAMVASIDPFEGEGPMLVRVEDGALLEAGPLELRWAVRLTVAGQPVERRYRALTRVEARPAPPR